MNFKKKTWMMPVACCFMGVSAATALIGCGGETSSNTPQTSSSVLTADPHTEATDDSVASSDQFSREEPHADVDVEKAVSRSSPQMDLPDRWNGTNARPPRVLLSEKYAATCLKNVGDSLSNLAFSSISPDGTVTAANTIESLLGSKLTVVVFCDLDFAASTEQVRRLDQEVMQAYREFGVTSVAVHVGDASTAASFASRLPDDIPLLIDTENGYQSVATMRPPRTFVLNSKGEIVWLDIEYSRGMRIELDNAIRFYLNQLLETAQSSHDASWR